MKEVQINQQLSGALKAVSQANEAKMSFLSRVSHDMRTPLNGILGITTLLKEQIKDETQGKDLEQLEISGKYLLNLVNDTLDVSRIESQKLELNPEVCNGAAVLKNIVTLIQPSVVEKNIQLTIEDNNVLSKMFYMDSVRIQQIFMNILSNAVKFTPNNGRIEMNIYKISETEKDYEVGVSIEDSGVGMSKEFIQHIFEPFSQADSSKKNIYKGTGLGITISKEIIQLMDGDIYIESELGTGTIVKFSFKAMLAIEEQVEQWSKPGNTDESYECLRNKHVLLCEDHPLNEMIVKRLLSGKDILVDHAVNGKIGVEMFEKSDVGYYDAVLMDVRMTVMDGIEATQHIRKLRRDDAEDIPIIAMTANALSSDVTECIDAGMNTHLGKPIEPVKLFATLKKYL